MDQVVEFLPSTWKAWTESWLQLQPGAIASNWGMSTLCVCVCVSFPLFLCLLNNFFNLKYCQLHGSSYYHYQLLLSSLQDNYTSLLFIVTPASIAHLTEPTCQEISAEMTAHSYISSCLFKSPVLVF